MYLICSESIQGHHSNYILSRRPCLSSFPSSPCCVPRRFSQRPSSVYTLNSPIEPPVLSQPWTVFIVQSSRCRLDSSGGMQSLDNTTVIPRQSLWNNVLETAVYSGTRVLMLKCFKNSCFGPLPNRQEIRKVSFMRRLTSPNRPMLVCHCGGNGNRGPTRDVFGGNKSSDCYEQLVTLVLTQTIAISGMPM
jgi:hypothetical protein